MLQSLLSGFLVNKISHTFCQFIFFVICFQDSLFVFVFWQLLYNVSKYGFPWVYPTCSLLRYRLIFFIKFGKFLAIISSNIFPMCLSSPSRTFFECTGTLNVVAQMFEAIFLFFNFYSSSLFLTLDNLNWFVFNFFLSSAKLNLSILYGKFLISVITVLKSKISLWFF